MQRSGFTLIELLIVVAIIAILAAIAVPNFIEAQVRAKVARVAEELRTIATALEMYNIDEGVYPADYRPCYLASTTIPGCWPTGPCWDLDFLLHCLTSPVAYLSTLPANDPFNLDPLYPSSSTGKYFYVNDADQAFWNDDCGRGSTPRYEKIRKPWIFGERWYYWLLKSVGPDQSVEWWGWPYDEVLYDSSNGTISHGDIMRIGP